MSEWSQCDVVVVCLRLLVSMKVSAAVDPLNCDRGLTLEETLSTFQQLLHHGGRSLTVTGGGERRGSTGGSSEEEERSYKPHDHMTRGAWPSVVVIKEQSTCSTLKAHLQQSRPVITLTQYDGLFGFVFVSLAFLVCLCVFVCWIESCDLPRDYTWK